MFLSAKKKGEEADAVLKAALSDLSKLSYSILLAPRWK